MKKTYRFLAFDCGATSGRAILGSLDGDALDIREIYRFPNKIVQVGGKHYWNIYEIYSHFLNVLSQLGKDGTHIDSIGIDTWGVDFGCIAPDGTLLGLPRSYRDPYTTGIPEEVFGKIPSEELYATCGTQILNFNTIFQLYAQKKEGFAPLLAADKILFLPDLLSYMLTGKMVCEYTDASTSGMMNQKSRELEKSLLEKLGIDPSILLDIVQPGTKVGTLLKSIAEQTGVGEVPVVAVAGHDTASAIAAVPAEDPGFAYLSSGTWSLMGIETESPIVSDRACELNFTNEGGIEGTTRFLKNITGMWLLEQCRKVWEKAGRTYNYAQISDMAAASTYSGIIDPDDERFANPVDMEAEILGSLREQGCAAPQGDGDIIRCIYLSLADKYKKVIDILQGFATFKIKKLHVIGGGSANDFLSQLTADTIGMPVVAGPVEATAIGNLLIQAKAAGVISDRWELRRIVAKAFQVKTFQPRASF